MPSRVIFSPGAKIERAAALLESTHSRMMSSTAIHFHLIKNDSQSASKDDLIEIRQELETGEFTVKFREYNFGNQMTHFLSNLSYRQVQDYIYTFIKNQSLDEDGYESIQMNLPCQPTMVVSVEKMKELYYRDHFLESVSDALATLTNSWTVVHPRKEIPVVKKPMRQNTHLFFD